MRKAVFAIAFILVTLVAIFFVSKLFGSRGPLDPLDGPGSYVETVTGTITEVGPVQDGRYTIMMDVDPETAARDYGTAQVRVIEADSGMFAVGDQVMVGFPGGYDFGRNPVVLENPYYVTLTSELE